MPLKRPKRRYQSIVRAVYGTPWAIREEKLDAIRAFLARRSAGDVLTREEVQAALSGKPQPANVGSHQAESKKVALINVLGVVAQRLSLMDEISGGVSTEAIGRALDKAVADGNVSTIVLNVDSPGGSVFGVEELANKIYAARGQKRIIAVANSEAASAAYWLASAAGELVVTPGGWVGSIGVLMLHLSTADWEANEGFATTVTRQPLGKAEGVAGEALTEEAKAHRQQLVDQTYETFVAQVARHRRVVAARVKSHFGQGRMLGADDAQAAGMVDRIATLEQVLSELGVSAKAQTDNASEPAFPLEGIGMRMNPNIFGALVRIGLCPITATIDDATNALARFFASRGTDLPAKEDDQLAALEAYIKQGQSAALGANSAPIAAALRPPGADDDRAADITAAVRLAMHIPAGRQVELIGELLSARDSAGQPITVQAAVRRIQKISAEQSAGQSVGATVITAGPAERDKFLAAGRDALLARMITGTRPKQIFDRAQGAYVAFAPPARGARRLGTLLGLAEECLVQGGYDSPTIRDLPKASLARLIMGASPREFGLSASSDGPAYNVSGMFSNILLDAAHVMLRKSYDDSRTTFQVWMKQAPALEDFKLTHKAIAGELGDPRAIPEDGAFEETTFADGKEKYQLTVWGEIFSLSWQAVVNDALGAFGEIPGKLGGAIRRKQNRIAYQALKDNAAMADGNLLFDADAQGASGHNNLTTGAGPPSVATLNTLTTKMMMMRGVNTTDGAALNIMPRWLIGPPALRGTILELLGSFANPAAGGSAVGSSGVKNIWENALEAVLDGELGLASSGGSDVAWYLSADADQVDTFEYAYLEGMETPVIETEAAFTHLALRWRIYHAFAVHPIDYRGLQKHAGV